ncbi:transposase [Mycobacterium canetti]|uniref:transposase n=1 Tax=Mycobacterium canetti TaxID=78331 RepID=UPI001932F7F5|nr:transposase [Mycobacterium canetti]
MEARRKFDAQFKEGAVRIVRETGKPIAQVARELGTDPPRRPAPIKIKSLQTSLYGYRGLPEVVAGWVSALADKWMFASSGG